MAKRNRRRRAAGLVTAPRHENDWSTELELLAYLTHCLKGRPNVDLFKATISDHIGKTVKVSWKRREVDRCIRSLWRHNQAAGYDKCDHETLYYHGIDVLDFGDNDLRLKCRIRERAQQISWELAQERGFERVTRSQRVSNHIGLEDTLNVWGTTVSRNRGKVTVEVPVRIPESVKVSYGSPPSRLTNLIDGQPHVTASIPRLEASSTEPLQRAPSVPDSEDFEQSSALPTASASPETELFGAAEEHYSIAATDNFIPTSPIPATRRHDEANVSLRTESPGNQSFRELGAQERHIFELTKQTEFYRQELIAVQKRNGDLQRQVDAIKDVEATTSASDRAALKAQLAQHYAEIQCLRTQLNNKAALQPFTRTDYTYPLGPEKKFVTDAVSSIEADTFNLLVSPETTDSESKVDVKSKGADLSVLWTTVFGDPAAKLSGVTFQAVVRSLTTAALCKWVLEPHLEEPLFANCYRGEVILELLANQGSCSLAFPRRISDWPQMDRKSLAALTLRHSRPCTEENTINRR
jgi:hypothetical protein